MSEERVILRNKRKKCWVEWPVGVEIELAVDWIKRNSSRWEMCADRFDWPLMAGKSLVPRQTLSMSPLDYS